jgi:hypothetical protein
MASDPSVNATPFQRLKSQAFVLLWLALIAQIAWMLFRHLHSHVSLASMWYPLTFVIALLLCCAC